MRDVSEVKKEKGGREKGGIERGTSSFSAFAVVAPTDIGQEKEKKEGRREGKEKGGAIPLTSFATSILLERARMGNGGREEKRKIRGEGISPTLRRYLGRQNQLVGR